MLYSSTGLPPLTAISRTVNKPCTVILCTCGTEYSTLLDSQGRHICHGQAVSSNTSPHSVMSFTIVDFICIILYILWDSKLQTTLRNPVSIHAHIHIHTHVHMHTRANTHTSARTQVQTRIRAHVVDYHLFVLLCVCLLFYSISNLVSKHLNLSLVM